MKLPTLPNPSTWSKRERLLAGVGVLALLIVAMDRLVLGPWWQHAQHVRKEIAKLETSIRTEQQLISRRPVIMAEATSYGEAFRNADSQPPDMSALLRELESLGTQSGLQLGEVKPLAQPSDGGGVTLDVQYTGSFQAWVHFIYLVQTSPSLLEIDRAVVAMDDLETSTLKGSVRLTSYAVRAAPPAS